MRGRRELAPRKQWHCRWCDRRIVMHQIGSADHRRKVRVWVHVASNVIWCRPPGESTLVIRTAAPRWTHPRKWSNA